MTPLSTDSVFITGGSSGIGEGLARAFHARGAEVVIAGRSEAGLRRVAESCPGMGTCTLDVTDAADVSRCASEVGERYPRLRTVVNNAGIQRLVDFRGEPPAPSELDAEVDTNLKGLLYVTAAFLPLLRRQPEARIVQVGSGLGYVPLVAAPVYSATKAAVHAFTVSLRAQLAGGTVQVVELIPPVVSTNLHRDQERTPPGALPLAAFVEKAMAALDAGKDEAPIGLASVLRVGSRVAPGWFRKIVNKPR